MTINLLCLLILGLIKSSDQCAFHHSKFRYHYCFNSLAHKSNFVGHVIVTTGLRRMHFPRPGFFLRWNSNL